VVKAGYLQNVEYLQPEGLQIRSAVSTQGNFIGSVTNYLSDASADFKLNVCQTPQTLQES
jgi:hypothetical protein